MSDDFNAADLQAIDVASLDEARIRVMLTNIGIPHCLRLLAMVEAVLDRFDHRGVILDHIAETFGMAGENPAVVAQRLREAFGVTPPPTSPPGTHNTPPG